MRMKALKISKRIMSLMMRTLMIVIRTFSSSPKRITATSLSGTTLPKRILAKAKRKRINCPLSRRRTSPSRIRTNHSKRPNS